jgi:cyclase
MLCKRIIPCLDVDRGRVVKGVRFFDHVDAGDPVEQARAYDQQGADELVFYDISASHEGRELVLGLVSRVVEVISMPLTVGGGVRTVEDATRLIQAGAEKVSLNTAAVLRPELVAEVAERFGRCATVLGVDVARVNRDGGERWDVFINGGRVNRQLDVREWVLQATRLGAGEIVLNVMNSDGTRQGYDVAMTRAIAELVNVPVVASGGAGSAQHMAEVLTEGKADAALAASIFHLDGMTVVEVKRELRRLNVPVRLEAEQADAAPRCGRN